MTGRINPERPRGHLGVDIGGTFTDAALEFAGRRYTAKSLTTQSAPDEGVIKAIELVLGSAGLSLADLDLVVHGTTLATNAIIERKGAKTAMLTTDGFRDVIEIGLEYRFDLFDLFLELPAPLVPRPLRFPIRERMGAGGRCLLPLDESDVASAISALRENQVESVAICFLHSYANAAHEERVHDLIRQALPDVTVSISSEVAPEMREYERFCTTCSNAYVQPKVASYLRRLESRLKEKGMQTPLLVMLSGGGITDIATACSFPVRLVESGPAGGAIFAASIAAENGLRDVVSFDMGGTTAKICLIDNGRPQTSRTFEAARVYRFKKGSGTPIRVPVIDMVEIGAGGGSIAHLDKLGRLSVGPESAGSEPGPVAFSSGGTEPTVTDANLLLGRISPSGFAGGKFPLNRKAASEAMSDLISSTLNLSAVEASGAVAQIVEENMASAARVHAIESGKDIKDRVLIAFGGGGPLHVAGVMQKLGMRRFLVPLGAGVGSAVGFLRAPISYEVVRSRHQQLASLDADEINSLLTGMSQAARTVVGQVARHLPLTETRTASMRYVGQGHEISITLQADDFSKEDAAALKAAFERRYREIYRRTVPGAEIEVLTWAVLVSTLAAETASFLKEADQYIPHHREIREVFDTGGFKNLDYRIYWRPELKPGARIVGPAIVEEDETSTVIPEGMAATILQSGAILGGYSELIFPEAALRESVDA